MTESEAKMILYELSIHFPDTVEIIEHEVDETGKFINGDICRLTDVIAQNKVFSDFGSLTDSSAIFRVGIRGYFDRNATFHDMSEYGNILDFKDEMHFYSYEKKQCLYVLKQFYKLIGEQNKKNGEMRRNISTIFKKEKANVTPKETEH